ncbi:hypothetical protein [Nonomuraea sp. NPDC005650]|uniref:hypothetical protein n=1 Tax=Nonomuraea sp. NPDC005650 TaxID=3157045 RepID=UPI0033BF9F7B
MRIKQGIIAATLIAGTLAVGSTPAHAIPPPPPGGDNLTVLSYYDGETLIGQRWFGCSQPGQWGILEGVLKISFVPC